MIKRLDAVEPGDVTTWGEVQEKSVALLSNGTVSVVIILTDGSVHSGFGDQGVWVESRRI